MEEGRRSRRKKCRSVFWPGCIALVLLVAAVLAAGAVWIVRSENQLREQVAERDSSAAVQTQLFPGDGHAKDETVGSQP